MVWLESSSHFQYSMLGPQCNIYATLTLSEQWSAGPIKEALLRYFVEGKVLTFNSRIETVSDPAVMRQFASSLSHYFPHMREMNLFVENPIDVGRVSTVDFPSNTVLHIFFDMVGGS
jgi:hypothetical protein